MSKLTYLKKNGKLLFAALRTSLLTYTVYKCFKYEKQMKNKETYYQPDNFWRGDKAIRELQKIMPILKKNVKLPSAKQALWQVH